MSASQRTATVRKHTNTGVDLVLSGDSCTDRALWHLSLILAEIAASCVQRNEHPSVLDAECENGNEQDVPDE